MTTSIIMRKDQNAYNDMDLLNVIILYSGLHLWIYMRIEVEMLLLHLNQSSGWVVSTVIFNVVKQQMDGTVTQVTTCDASWRALCIMKFRTFMLFFPPLFCQ